MLNFLRTITALSGLGLLVMGLLWWIQPATAAEILKASLLEGTGLSTQIGDSGAFFVGSGLLLAWGALRNRGTLVLVGGVLVGLVVPGRALSAMIHGGMWTPDEMISECFIVILAVATASAIQRHNQSSLFR